jgi:hypothetical protein
VRPGVGVVIDLFVRETSCEFAGRPYSVASFDQADHSVFDRKLLTVFRGHEVVRLPFEVERHFDRGVERLPVLGLVFAFVSIEEPVLSVRISQTASPRSSGGAPRVRMPSICS